MSAALASGPALGRSEQTFEVRRRRERASPLYRRHRPECDTGVPGAGQTAKRVEATIGMLVRQAAIRFLQVNGCIVMVVMVGGLTMQQGVLKPLCSLRLLQRACHDQALPQHGKQHQQCSKAAGHALDFRRGLI